jgi:predicted Zn-dependent protease
LAYGDSPRDGVVRGGRFIHPGLGIAFEVPEGFSLENTRSAVLGTTADGNRRLLFDQIEAKDGQGLDAILKATWNDSLDPAGSETGEVNGHPAAFALSRGKDWTFRLAAIRLGEATYRMIMAAKGSADPNAAFRHWTETLTEVPPESVAALRPTRLQIVPATGTSPEELTRRMVVPDRPFDRFLVLNGLERGAQLVPGRSYKIVTE